MRMRNRFQLCLMAAIVIGITAIPALAKKGGNGNGGGGDDGGSQSNAPPVEYQVGFIPVAGLNVLCDVNDYGQSLCRVDIASVPTAISSTANGTLAVVDLDGNVVYPELLLNTTTDWDLYSSGKLNNLGQILCTAYTFIDAENYEIMPLLLTPDGLGNYDVEVMSGYLHSIALNDIGDLVLLESSSPETGDYHLVLLPNGELPIDLSHLPVSGGSGSTMNNLGQFLGWSDDVFPIPDRTVRIEPDGSLTPFEELPDAAPITYDTHGFAVDLATDLNEFGIAIGTQKYSTGKGKNKKLVRRTVLYDVDGSASWYDTLPAYDLRVNDQLVNNEFFVAGYRRETSSEAELAKDLWIKTPGYESTYLVDLMDDANKSAWAALGFKDDNYSNEHEFELLTPRFADGSIDTDTYPTIVGFIYNSDETGGGGSFGMGLFVLSPVTTEP